MDFFNKNDNLKKMYEICTVNDIKPNTFDNSYSFNSDYSTIFFTRTPADVHVHYHIVIDDLEIFDVPNFTTDIGLIYDVNENMLHIKVLHLKLHTGTTSPAYPRLGKRSPFYMTEEEHFQESLINDILPYDFYIHVYKLFHTLISHQEAHNDPRIELPTRTGRYEEFYSEPWKKS